MSGFLFDTNVWLDIAPADPVWLPWSERQLRVCASEGSSLNPFMQTRVQFTRLEPNKVANDFCVDLYSSNTYYNSNMIRFDREFDAINVAIASFNEHLASSFLIRVYSTICG